jgi:cytochrome c oxidase assembly protein subunit 11
VTALARRNSRTAALAALLVAAMVGLAYASVPLYRLFCQVTGFDGTPQRAATIDVKPVPGESVYVRFDANISPSMPWEFRPEQNRRTVTIGERQMAFFVAKNLSAAPVTGSASFNVTPTQAAPYFTKVQCFCFTEQTLKPGEEVRMPVVFYVDPKILQDKDAHAISEITLSYTFYPVDSGKERS